MTLTTTQTAITVAALALGSLVARSLPPLIFPNGKPHPKIIDELTPMIPPAVIGLLVVYSLKNIDFLSETHGIPELVSAAVVAALHFCKNNMLLSIIVGTACYMILIRIM